jgi:hypothetical protein
MPDAKKPGPADPGLSDIKGRMLVLEVVAMTSLALALDTSGEDDGKLGRGVLHLIREAVGNKCDEMGLSDHASSTAQAYAEELIGTAMATLYPSTH